MKELFINYAGIIIFLHVLGAIIWVGGMIAIRIAVHPTMQSVDDAKIKLGKTLMIMGKLFNLVLPFIFILLLTAIVMLLGIGFKGTELAPITYIKEGIWTVMTLNFAFMYLQRAKAQKLFNIGNLVQAKQKVALIPNVLLPINIILGLVAVYLGVTLRGY
ncbi:MAG: hypothetical protein K0U47_07725 [Epsilonproteobacteria bacterium]|nr:hypothetical protein [Campylobacterota bacterium]